MTILIGATHLLCEQRGKDYKRDDTAQPTVGVDLWTRVMDGWRVLTTTERSN